MAPDSYMERYFPAIYQQAERDPVNAYLASVKTLTEYTSVQEVADILPDIEVVSAHSIA